MEGIKMKRRFLTILGEEGMLCTNRIWKLFFLMGFIFIASSASASSCITDLQLLPSKSRIPPPDPSGYKLIGYWDVDRGGAVGSDRSTGDYMTGLYYKSETPADMSSCIVDIMLIPSGKARPPEPPEGYTLIGYWDVDAGGAHSPSPYGSPKKNDYMAGLYVKWGEIQEQHPIVDIQLIASRDPKPRKAPEGYTLIGYWDVDRGGAVGSDGSTGDYMTGLYVKGGEIKEIHPYEQNPALHDVKGLIENLPIKYCPILVRNTYSTKHLFTTYSAGIDHVQGIAMIQNNYIIAQAARWGKKETLLVIGDGENKCSFHLIGKRFPHSGGIQSCGNILAVPVEPAYVAEKHKGKGSEILFVDFSNPHHPIELPLKIDRPEKYAGAVGIAYHAEHKRHYVVVSADDLDLYGSNGLPLSDPNCEFTLLKSLKASGHSGGGTNLLYESTGKLYMTGLTRDDSGRETIEVSEIENPEKEATVVPTLTKKLSQSGSKNNYSAGFRWGGGIIVKNSEEIDAIAVARTLTYGLAQNYTKVKRWTKSPWVRLLHNGAYVAKIYLSWKVDGQKKTWSSGKKSVGYEVALVLPENARNVHLNIQAMTGLLGNKAWKDIIRKEIPTQYTYEFIGTTLSPKYKAW